MVTAQFTGRNDCLKFIAAILMVLDHVGAIFFPSLLYLRMPGRICFPIFAYYTAMGAGHTTNSAKYFGRILIFAIITQPIYNALPLHGWNVLFTLLYGAIVVHLWRQDKVFCLCLAILLAAASVLFPSLDYGWYGILTILLFYLTESLPFLCFLSQGVLQGIYLAMGSHPIQALSLFALPLLNSKRLPQVTLPRYFFYVFYPLHLGILLLIRNFL